MVCQTRLLRRQVGIGALAPASFPRATIAVMDSFSRHLPGSALEPHGMDGAGMFLVSCRSFAPDGGDKLSFTNGQYSRTFTIVFL
jgi:hypothetical protein